MNSRAKPPRTKALRESLFDNTVDGLAYCKMIINKQGKPVDFTYIEVNKRFENLWGLKNVVGKRMTVLVPGVVTSNPELFEMCSRVSVTHKPEKLEMHVEVLTRWFLISVYSPKKGFFVLVSQDITERKRIEKELDDARVAARNVLEDLQVEKEALARARAKDDALFESLGEGLIAVDTDAKITLINKVAVEMLGWKMKDPIGAPVTDITLQNEAGDPIPLDKRPTSLALATGKIVQATHFYVRSNATKFPMAITAAPISLGGKTIGLIETIRDVTREREIDRAKSEFVSLVSHQLRTPLSAVRWYSEMLLSGDAGKLGEKQQKYVAEINHGNLRMIELVNALLSVSQLEMGTLATKTEDIDVWKVVRDVMQDVETRAKEQGIRLSVNISDSLAYAQIDPKLIRMLIENLVVNAIKYTPKKGSVAVEVTEVKKGGMLDGRMARSRCLGLAVSDTGIGIPTSQKGRIFSKLFRADNARLMDTDGTGLGLYLVKRIAEYCKGEVWFLSAEGKGSTFFALLPLLSSETPLPKHAALIRTSHG
jgi:PAS domain S-box-containing protein